MRVVLYGVRLLLSVDRSELDPSRRHAFDVIIRSHRGFRNLRVTLRRFDIIFNTRQRCFTGTPRLIVGVDRAVKQYASTTVT